MREQTYSVCPVCLKTIPALRVEENGNIYLEKTCPAHGKSRALIWEGAPDYRDWGGAHAPTRPAPDTPVEPECPRACGLCPQHRQQTCCVLLELTRRCNLCCPVCFAGSVADADDDPSLDEIARWYDILRRDAPQANIQLSGGEPTVRDDLPEIIRMGRERGFTFFQLNTNGLRLADDPDYAVRLKEAGLSCVFLQFDGVTDEVYTALRGAPLLERKKRAIAHCARAGLGVVLVPTVTPEVNLNQVGAILDFAMEHLPSVRGVHFQPLSHFGRYDPGFSTPLTLPRLLREIEAQTGGRLKAEHFTGGTAEHSLCSFSGNFLLNPDGSVSALKSAGSSCCGCGAPADDDETASACCGTPAETGCCGEPAESCCAEPVEEPSCCSAPETAVSCCRTQEASSCCAIPEPQASCCSAPEQSCGEAPEESSCCGESAQSCCGTEEAEPSCCGTPEPSSFCCAVPEPRASCGETPESAPSCCAPEATAVEKTRDVVARRWGGEAPDDEAPPADPDSMDALLYQLRHKRFSVSAMAFMDCWSLDLERLQNCYVHVMSRDGRRIPFCAYNLTSESGQPLYRVSEEAKGETT